MLYIPGKYHKINLFSINFLYPSQSRHFKHQQKTFPERRGF